MHVLYLTQVFETEQDTGSERHLYFCRYLVQQGHSATAITSNVDYKQSSVKYPHAGWRVRRQVSGIDILYVYSYANIRGSFKRRFWYYLTYLFAALLAGMSVKHVDVIYAVSTPLTVGLLGYLLSRLRSVPFVFEVTDVWPDAAVAVGVVNNQRLIEAAHRLEMFCYHRATRIVALTQGIRENIVGKGISPDKVVLITNGVDPNLFQAQRAAEGDRASLRHSVNMDDRFVCMYIGAHGAYNALDTVVRAADALHNDPRYLFVLVGDGDAKVQLQAMAQDRKLTNIRFLPPVPRRETASLLQTADVFLLPNRLGEFFTMNLPNKLFDFLAAGAPIVVAGRGESADLVERAGAGCVVDAEAAAGMAQAIVALAALRPEERAAMGRSGRQFVMEHYDREKQSSTFLDILMHACWATKRPG